MTPMIQAASTRQIVRTISRVLELGALVLTLVPLESVSEIFHNKNQFFTMIEDVFIIW